MNIRQNKGITLTALAISIVVLLMILGVTTYGSIDSYKKAKDNKEITELNMIQNVILQENIKVQYTKEDFPGDIVSKENVQSVVDEINNVVEDESGKVSLKGNSYYKLNEDALKVFVIENVKDEYIVNYKTGEVINVTKKVTSTNKALYVYAKDIEE